MHGGAKLGAAGALAALVLTGGAYAQSRMAALDLTWQAPLDVCPSREQVLAEVARVLGAAHVAQTAATARVEVAHATEGRWLAELSVDARGAHTERRFEAETCDAVASAAALILAIAIEGGVPAPRPAEVAPLPPGPAPLAHAETPAPPHDSQLVAAAAAVADKATLPSLAGGAEASFGFAYGTSTYRLRFLASASLFSSQVATVASHPGQGGSFALVGASARACASLIRGAFDFGPCLGAEVETMSVSGFGRSATPNASFTPQDATAQWLAPLGAALAALNLSRHVAIVARVEALVPLSRPVFRVHLLPPEGDLVVYQPSWLAARAAIGVEVRFF